MPRVCGGSPCLAASLVTYLKCSGRLESPEAITYPVATRSIVSQQTLYQTYFPPITPVRPYKHVQEIHIWEFI